MITREAGDIVSFYRVRTPGGWVDRFETKAEAENACYWAKLSESSRNVIYDVMEIELPYSTYENDI